LDLVQALPHKDSQIQKQKNDKMLKKKLFASLTHTQNKLDRPCPKIIFSPQGKNPQSDSPERHTLLLQSLDKAAQRFVVANTLAYFEALVG